MTRHCDNEGSDLLDYLKYPGVFKYSNGFVDIPKGPGLGIEIDEQKVQEAAKEGHNWKILCGATRMERLLSGRCCAPGSEVAETRQLDDCRVISVSDICE